MAGFHADESLLHVGLALQKYRQHNPDTNVPVPRYVIVGLQSAGKTRLLSMLARTKIGGAEKANCGTRCPVEYTFEPGEPESPREFRFGTSVSNLKAGSANDVAVFVTSHMDSIAGQERCNQQGFSEEPIFVQVKSPKATPLVVADCPGLQGSEQKANNDCIKAVYRSQLEAPNSTAVIVSALPATLDIEQITKELGEFVHGADLPPEVYPGAVLLVNRLDAVKSSLAGSDEALRAFQNQAAEMYGLVHMGFMCLVPEVLGNQHSMPKLRSDTPVEEQDLYFAETAWDLEKAALESFSRVHLGREQPPDNVGVKACINLVFSDLKRKVMAGWDCIGQALWAEWTQTLEPQLYQREREAVQVDDEELKADLDQYLAIHCEGLAGFQADDLPRRMETSASKVNREWVVQIMEARELHTRSACKTFVTECEEETGLRGNAALDRVLLHSRTRIELEQAKGHPVADMIDEHYCGEAAIRRLVTMQRYAWMREPIREYSLPKIVNMGAFMNAEDERGRDLRAIIRKAMAEVEAKSAKDITRFMSMVERDLVSPCDYVRRILKESVPMLSGTPKLRDFVDDECVQRRYAQLISKCCKEAKHIMLDLLKARFSSLSLDEPLNLVRILLCSGFDLFLLDPPSNFRSKTHNPPGEEAISAILMDLAELHLPQKVLELLEIVAHTVLSSPDNTESDEVFFKAIVAYSNERNENPALTMALNDRLNITNLPLLEYKDQVGRINTTIRAVVRFYRGMMLMDVQRVLENNIIIEARQIRSDMVVQMQRISDHLFSSESREFLERLKAPADTLAESRALLERLTAFGDTLEQISGAARVSEQLAYVCQMLPARLEPLHRRVAAKSAGNMEEAEELQRSQELELKRRFFERLEAGPSVEGVKDTKEQVCMMKASLLSELEKERERTRELQRKLDAAEGRICAQTTELEAMDAMLQEHDEVLTMQKQHDDGLRLVQAERDEAQTERDDMERERDEAVKAKSAMRKEHDAAQKSLEALQGERAKVQRERDEAVKAKSAMQKEHDKALKLVEAERDRAQTERAFMQRERDEAVAAKSATQQEQDKALKLMQSERDRAQTERAFMQRERDEAVMAKGAMQKEHDRALKLVQEERDKAQTDRASMQQERVEAVKAKMAMREHHDEVQRSLEASRQENESLQQELNKLQARRSVPERDVVRNEPFSPTPYDSPSTRQCFLGSSSFGHLGANLKKSADGASRTISDEEAPSPTAVPPPPHGTRGGGRPAAVEPSSAHPEAESTAHKARLWRNHYKAPGGLAMAAIATEEGLAGNSTMEESLPEEPRHPQP